MTTERSIEPDAGRTRTEKDTLGPIEVPADRLWGPQTQRSLEHFRISGERMPLAVVHALALVKKAVALVHVELGVLDAAKGRAAHESSVARRPGSGKASPGTVPRRPGGCTFGPGRRRLRRGTPRCRPP